MVTGGAVTGWCLCQKTKREMKTRLLLGRKARTNLGSVLKSRAMTLPTKVRLVKAVVFPVVMYGCESWTTEKAEHRRIDALELWCWRRLLRVPWTARRSNQSILEGISHDYSSEGCMLKLKLHYSGHLMWRAISPEKILMLGRLRMRKGWQRMRWLDGIPDSMEWVWANSGRRWRTRKPGVLQSNNCRLQRVKQNWGTEQRPLELPWYPTWEMASYLRTWYLEEDFGKSNINPTKSVHGVA